MREAFIILFHSIILAGVVLAPLAGLAAVSHATKFTTVTVCDGDDCRVIFKRKLR